MQRKLIFELNIAEIRIFELGFRKSSNGLESLKTRFEKFLKLPGRLL